MAIVYSRRCQKERVVQIIVWGLGYVGTVSAACLARLGHSVVGVEPHAAKVEALKAGKSAIKEPGLAELVNETVASGRLTVVQEGVPAVAEADLSLICVGTPSSADGSPVLDYLKNVAADIGRGLAQGKGYHVVVLRSTVFPGTARKILLPILEEHSGRRAGREFGLVMNPEFLRETSSIADFFAPPYTVIGELDKRSGDLSEGIYREIAAPIYRVSLEEAELLKLACNSFHGLKVGFANEIGRLCDRLGVDAQLVMRLLCADTKLNISPAYLRPGFAFGGSCLPKDLRSLLFHARRLGVEVPILDGVLPSNRAQIEAVRVKVQEVGARRVTVLGLSFKAGTDDLRESPVLALIRDLWQDGIDVLVHDPDVRPEEMLGSNREYLERQLPQIREILRPRLADVLKDCDLVILTQKRSEFASAVSALEDRAAVIDLTGSPAPDPVAVSERAALD